MTRKNRLARFIEEALICASVAAMVTFWMLWDMLAESANKTRLWAKERLCKARLYILDKVYEILDTWDV